MKQGDWVYAWNYKQPEKKVKTRFLHRLDGIRPSNICTSPDTTDTYPKKVNLRRYDMVVPDKSTVEVPQCFLEDDSNTSKLNFSGVITIIVLIALLWIYFVSYDSRSDIQDLRESHYDLSGKVSGIEIKGDDTANQLMLSIENQYWQEIQTAVDIAYEAGYPHRKVVLINPSANIVRLIDSDYSEISVNIVSKVITTYSPN